MLQRSISRWQTESCCWFEYKPHSQPSSISSGPVACLFCFLDPSQDGEQLSPSRAVSEQCCSCSALYRLVSSLRCHPFAPCLCDGCSVTRNADSPGHYWKCFGQRKGGMCLVNGGRKTVDCSPGFLIAVVCEEESSLFWCVCQSSFSSLCNTLKQGCLGSEP